MERRRVGRRPRALRLPSRLSRTNIVADDTTVAVFVRAALLGGAAAGAVASRAVNAFAKVRPRSADRTIAAERRDPGGAGRGRLPWFWEPTVDRLPPSAVSAPAIASLGAGTGSAWTGCYEYNGHFRRSNGLVGAEGGLIRVVQPDGRLTLLDRDAPPLSGGVGRGGDFRAACHLPERRPAR
jgi:hypothetical protein